MTQRHVLVDAHVHVHRCYREDDFLAGARSNFQAAKRQLSLAEDSPGVLLLTESLGEDVFGRFRERAAGRQSGPWTFHPTGEESSLSARLDGRDELILIAGRQIATGDGLEVLALATRREIADGLPLAETLERVDGGRTLAAVPWGFGKWWGRRGKLLADLLAKADPSRFFLGDNGGRPRSAAPPRLFARAAERGVRVLPGSDPLPFARQARRAGSYGFVLPAEIGPEQPAARLTALLCDPATRPRPYGRRTALVPFVRDQLAMQLRKRSGRAA